MALFQCKACGGSLSISEGSPVAVCEYCGTKQTIPGDSSEKKVNLFNRANKLRTDREFDKAAAVYESIAAEFPVEAEAYWGLCLCRFGIEYVDDPATGRKIPTCHRTSFESIFDDDNFEKAKGNADSEAMNLYQEEAKEIDRIQQAILNIAKNEKPYDIFICYKETDDETRDRTLDSVRAQDIYDKLVQKGYKVFFSRITLEGKLGTDFEPYIFAALNSAKVMLAVGGSFNNFNAVWVKNEWSRFLSLMKTDKDKVLIPCYFDIDPRDMPNEFRRLQGQDMNKVGFLQDLIRGIEKIIPLKSNAAAAAATAAVFGSASVTMGNLLTRAFEDELPFENWAEADKACDRVLEIDPKNGRAYVGKLMAELQVCSEKELDSCTVDYSSYANYVKAEMYSEGEEKEKLHKHLAATLEHLTLLDADASYEAAIQALERGDYRNAEQLLDKAAKNHDVSALQERCRNEKQSAEEFSDKCNKLYSSYDPKRGQPPFAEKAQACVGFKEYIQRKYPGFDSGVPGASAHGKVLLWLLPIGIGLIVFGVLCGMLDGTNSADDSAKFLIGFGVVWAGILISWILNGKARIMGKLYYFAGVILSLFAAYFLGEFMIGSDEMESAQAVSRAYIPFLAGTLFVVISLLLIIRYIGKSSKIRHYYRDTGKLERLEEERVSALAYDVENLKAKYSFLPAAFVNNCVQTVQHKYSNDEEIHKQEQTVV